MNDTSPTEPKPPGPVPADDPERSLTHVSPDTDESLPHLGVVGDTYTILVSGADTAGRYALIDMHVPPGGGPPPHRHDFEEMFTILTARSSLRSAASARLPRRAKRSMSRPTPRTSSETSPNGLRDCSVSARPRARRCSSRRSASRSRTGPSLRRRSTMQPPPRLSRRRSHLPRSTGLSCCSAIPSRDPRNRETTVSHQQRDALDELLRDAPLDLGGDVPEQRVNF